MLISDRFKNNKTYLLGNSIGGKNPFSSAPKAVGIGQNSAISNSTGVSGNNIAKANNLTRGMDGAKNVGAKNNIVKFDRKPEIKKAGASGENKHLNPAQLVAEYETKQRQLERDIPQNSPKSQSVFGSSSPLEQKQQRTIRPSYDGNITSLPEKAKIPQQVIPQFQNIPLPQNNYSQIPSQPIPITNGATVGQNQFVNNNVKPLVSSANGAVAVGQSGTNRTDAISIGHGSLKPPIEGALGIGQQNYKVKALVDNNAATNFNTTYQQGQYAQSQTAASTQNNYSQVPTQPTPLVNIANVGQNQFLNPSVQSSGAIAVGQQTQNFANTINANDPLNKGYLERTVQSLQNSIPVGQQSLDPLSTFVASDSTTKSDDVSLIKTAKAINYKTQDIASNLESGAEQTFGVGQSSNTQNVIPVGASEPKQEGGDFVDQVQNVQIDEINEILTKTKITLGPNCRSVMENYLVDLEFDFPAEVQKYVEINQLRARIGSSKENSSVAITKDQAGKWYALINIGQFEMESGDNVNGGYREIYLDLNKTPREEKFSNAPKIQILKADYRDPKYKQKIDEHNQYLSIRRGLKYDSNLYELYKRIAKETKLSSQSKKEFKSGEPIILYFDMPTLGDKERIPTSLRIQIDETEIKQYLIQVDVTNPDPRYFKYYVECGARIVTADKEVLKLQPKLIITKDITGTKDEAWVLEKVKTITVSSEKSKVKDKASVTSEAKSEVLEAFKKAGSPVNLSPEGKQKVIEVGQSNRTQAIGLGGALGLAVGGSSVAGQAINGSAEYNWKPRTQESSNQSTGYNSGQANTNSNSNSQSQQGQNSTQVPNYQSSQNQQQVEPKKPLGSAIAPPTNASLESLRLQKLNSAQTLQGNIIPVGASQAAGAIAVGASQTIGSIAIGSKIGSAAVGAVSAAAAIGGLAALSINKNTTQKIGQNRFNPSLKNIASVGQPKPTLGSAIPAVGNIGQSASNNINPSFGNNLNPNFGSPNSITGQTAQQPQNSLSSLKNSTSNSNQTSSNRLPKSGVIVQPFSFGNYRTSDSGNAFNNIVPFSRSQPFGSSSSGSSTPNSPSDLLNRNQIVKDNQGNPVRDRDGNILYQNKVGGLGVPALAGALSINTTTTIAAAMGSTPIGNSLARGGNSLSNPNSSPSSSYQSSGGSINSGGSNDSSGQDGNDGGSTGNGGGGQPPSNRRRTGGQNPDDEDENLYSDEQNNEGEDDQNLGDEYSPEEIPDPWDDDSEQNSENESGKSSNVPQKLLSRSEQDKVANNGNNEAPDNETEEQKLARLQGDVDLQSVKNKVNNLNSNNPFAPDPSLNQSVKNAKVVNKNSRIESLKNERNELTKYIELIKKRVGINGKLPAEPSIQSNQNPLGPQPDTQPIRKNVGDFAKKQAINKVKDIAKKAAFQFFLANAWWILPTILALILMLMFVGGIVAIECDNGKSDVRTFKTVDTLIKGFEAVGTAASGDIVGGVGKAIQAGIGTAEALVVYDSGLVRSDFNKWITTIPGCSAPCVSGGVSNVKGDIGYSAGPGTVSTGGIFTPEVRAFLDTIANWETEGADKLGPISYNSGNGKANLFDSTKYATSFPTIDSPGNGGRYQVLPVGDRADANNALKKLGLPEVTGFDDKNQDRFAIGRWYYRQSRSDNNPRKSIIALPDLLKSDFKTAVGIASGEWASAPNLNSDGFKHADTKQTKAGRYEEYEKYYRQRLAVYTTQASTPTTATSSSKTPYLSPNRFSQPLQLARLETAKEDFSQKLSQLIGFPVQYKTFEENESRPEMNSYNIPQLDQRINEFNQVMNGRIIVEALATANSQKVADLLKSGIAKSQDSNDAKYFADGKFDAKLSDLLSNLNDKGFTFTGGPRSLRPGAKTKSGNPSQHGVGLAYDFAAIGKKGGTQYNIIQYGTGASRPPTEEMWTVFKEFTDSIKSSGLLKGNQLIGPAAAKTKGYVFLNTADVISNHEDHIHVGVSGDGVLNSGGASASTNSSDSCCPSPTTPTQPVKTNDTSIPSETGTPSGTTTPNGTATPSDAGVVGEVGDEETDTESGTQPTPVDVEPDGSTTGFLDFFQPIEIIAAGRPSSYSDIDSKHREFMKKVAEEKGYTPITLYSGSTTSVGGETLKSDAAESFNKMKKEAEKSGVTLTAISGYRNNDTQVNTFFGIGGGQEDAIPTGSIYNGSNEAVAKPAYLARLQHSAVPGYSEHATGNAVDINSLKRSFDSTKEYKWLKDNASKFNFTQTYTEKNATNGANYEPWHWYFGTRSNSTATPASSGSSGSSGSTGSCCPGGGGSSNTNTNVAGSGTPADLKDIKLPDNYSVLDQTGKLLYGKDDNTPINPASAIKVIIAALIAKNNIDLNKQHTFTEEEIYSNNEDQFESGVADPISDLVTKMLTTSNNSAANALISELGGLSGVDQKAKEVGLNSVNFKTLFDGSGETKTSPSTGRYASATDLAKAMKLIFDSTGPTALGVQTAVKGDLTKFSYSGDIAHKHGNTENAFANVAYVDFGGKKYFITAFFATSYKPYLQSEVDYVILKPNNIIDQFFEAMKVKLASPEKSNSISSSSKASLLDFFNPIKASAEEDGSKTPEGIELTARLNSGKIRIWDQGSGKTKADYIKDIPGSKPQLIKLILGMSDKYDIAINALGNNTHSPGTDHEKGLAVDIGSIEKSNQNVEATDPALLAKFVNEFYSESLVSQLLAKNELKAKIEAAGGKGFGNVNDGPGHLHFGLKPDGSFNGSNSTTSSSVACCPGGSSSAGTTSGGVATSPNITNADADQKYMADAKAKALWTPLQSPLIALIHYTAIKSNSDETLATLGTTFKEAIAKGPGKSGNQGWAHYLIGKDGKSYQIMTEDTKVSGSDGKTGAYFNNGTKMIVNDHALQYEIHYDAKFNGQSISDAQLQSLAKTIVKSGLKAEQIYTHWAVQPSDRSDSADWISPDGNVSPELVKFIKYAGWATDDAGATKIAKQILKQNIENAIKVHEDSTIPKGVNGGEVKLKDLKNGITKVKDAASFLDFLQPVKAFAVESPDQILLTKVDPIANTTLTSEEKAFLDMLAAKENGKYTDLKPVGADKNVGKYQIGPKDVTEALKGLKKAGYDIGNLTQETWLEPKNQDLVAIGRMLWRSQFDKRKETRKLGDILKNGDGFMIALGYASEEFQSMPVVPGFTHTAGGGENGYTIEVTKLYYQKMLAVYGGTSAGNTSGIAGINCNKNESPTGTQPGSSNADASALGVSKSTLPGTVSKGGPFTPAVRALMDTITKGESGEPSDLGAYNSGNFGPNDFDSDSSTDLHPVLKSKGIYKTPKDCGNEITPFKQPKFIRECFPCPDKPTAQCSSGLNIGRYQYYGDHVLESTKTREKSPLGYYNSSPGYFTQDVKKANEGLSAAGINFTIKDFQKTSQDFYVVGKYGYWAKKLGAEPKLNIAIGEGTREQFDKVIDVIKSEWASVPGAGSGQENLTKDQYFNIFKDRLAFYQKDK